ncbi:major facilitator superfamily domain-containing protein [Aspergillus pseudoustus]|uniref:Major facilitator superfamily domain-containing protein n=1 Tax=Aspergillus pseudoustus TaxID=1810923 RepID=A0ABR4J0Z5_9EURO
MTSENHASEKVGGAESVHIEDGRQMNGLIYGIDEAHQKRVIRRIDIRLLPILGLMYAISLIDRSNYSLAYVSGMAIDLRLDIGQRYTILVLVFFIGCIFEIPSNMVMQRAGTANWLTFLGIGFGAVNIGMGFSNTWQEMAVCRTILGVLEAGFIPGCIYLITCWYTRFEVGKRLAIFWIGSIIINAFANMLSYALALLKGTHGLNGWRWIFIIEGSITVGLCIIGWFLLIDFPTKSDSLLSPEEKQFVIDRINNDRGDGDDDPMTLRRVLRHLKDWKLYVWSFNLMATTVPAFAYGYFKTIILTGMGYSVLEAQLLSIPPDIFGAVIALISGWLSDRYKIRGPIIIVHQLVTAAGMLIFSYTKAEGVRYCGLFLAGGGFQYCIPGILAFQSNNIISQSKRGVAAATCMLGGSIGGIIASVSFKSSEIPYYNTGIWVAFGVSILSICLILMMDLYFWKQNKNARERGILLEGLPGWYYTL